MGNYVTDNLEILSARHYVRRAATQDYWHDFRVNRLDQYRDRYGEDFCMVIYGSMDQDDAYVMPYKEVKTVYNPAYLDDRGRWIGSITNDTLFVRRSDRSVLVLSFYNAFNLLDDSQTNSTESVPDMHFIDDVEISQNIIKQQAAKFNRVYRNVTPHKRRDISERIARPNAISEWLKHLHSYTCQICGQKGFLRSKGILAVKRDSCGQKGFEKRNGNRYVETHHITELHKLISGSYCSDNVIVVCAECHRKLHYADVSFAFLEGNTVEITINGVHYTFERNVISE